jgi:trans-2,3-dihydro-3-hydroxyanthranilate isomerase
MFAPEVGVPEDPATGSACAALGGYLGRRLLSRTGDAAWQVQQGIEMGRPSRLALDVRVEAGRPTRVRVGGGCVLVAHAEMEIPE